MNKRFTSKILNPRQAEVRRQCGDSVEFAVSGDEGMNSIFKKAYDFFKSKVCGAISSAYNQIFPQAEMSVQYRKDDLIDTKLPPISEIVSVNLPAPRPLCFDSGTSVPTPGRFDFNNSEIDPDNNKKTIPPHDYMKDLPEFTEEDRVKANTPVWKKHSFQVPERFSKKNLPCDVQVKSNPIFEVPQMTSNSKNGEEIPMKSQKSEDFAQATKPVVQDLNSSSKNSLGGSSDKFRFEDKGSAEHKEKPVKENPNSTPILPGKNMRRNEPSNSKNNIFSSPSASQSGNAYLMTPEFKMPQGEKPKNIGFFVSENEKQNPHFESEGFVDNDDDEDDEDEIISKKSETENNAKAGSDKRGSTLGNANKGISFSDQKNEASNFSNPFASASNPIKLLENPFKNTEIAAKTTENPSKIQENPFKPADNPFKNPENTSKTFENSLKNQENTTKPLDNPFKPQDSSTKIPDNLFKPQDSLFKPQDNSLKPQDNSIKPQENPFKPTETFSKPQDTTFKLNNINPPPLQSGSPSSDNPQSKLPSSTDTSPNNPPKSSPQKPNPEINSLNTSSNSLSSNLISTDIPKETTTVNNPQSSNSLNFNNLVSNSSLDSTKNLNPFNANPIPQTSIKNLSEEEKLIKCQQEKIEEEQRKLAAQSSSTDTNVNNPFLSVSNVQQAKPSYVFGSSSSAPSAIPSSLTNALSNNAFAPQVNSGISNSNPFQPTPVTNIPYNPFNNQSSFSNTSNNISTGNFPSTNSNQNNPFPAIQGTQQNPFSTNPANQPYNFSSSTIPQNPYAPNPINQSNPFNNSSFVPSSNSTSNPFSANPIPSSNPASNPFSANPIPSSNPASNPFSTNSISSSNPASNPFSANSIPSSNPTSNLFSTNSIPSSNPASNPFSTNSIPSSNPFNAHSTYQSNPFTGNSAISNNSFVQNSLPFNSNPSNHNPYSNQPDQNLHDIPMNSNLPYENSFNSAFSSNNYNTSYQGQSSNSFMQTDTSTSNFPRQNSSSISFVAQNPFSSGQNSSAVNPRPNIYASNFGTSNTDIRVETNNIPSQVTGTFSMGSVPRSNTRPKRFH
ncbi:hypothetical protein SteCoe_19833 [Stentor coeruleus]|uniref:Uncharacterized protein n=1 Tax=Stentor coeruleus TaxID=5963 RepID=A0A1R2BTC4_9CILI|nr:hypothetical protein SteCoe_19833 [Stentor coeruleus]